MILVAQANETNRQVIWRQLTALGYAADMAANGQQALQYWRGGGYLLLFTDLHELDGCHLTATIRVEEPAPRHTPIIALSVTGLPSETQRARAAGFDDYLSQPTTLPNLQAMLEKWLAPHTSALDISVLEGLIGNQTEFVDEILHEFRTTAFDIASALHAAVLAGAPQDAANAAHKLKSSARAVGARRLAEWCSIIERAGHDARANDLTALLGGFDAEMLAVDQALTIQLDRKPLAPPAANAHLGSES